MSEAWVVNASPLILFSRIARLDLIERLAPAILVPNAVIEEVRAGQREDRKAATALEGAGRYRVENVTVAASMEHWDLGSGESQVIAHSVGTAKGLGGPDLSGPSGLHRRGGPGNGSPPASLRCARISRRSGRRTPEREVGKASSHFQW